MSARRVFKHRDPISITDVRIDTYGYGGGVSDHGIQITMVRDQMPPDPRVLVARLPHPDAVDLARRILSTYGETTEPSVIHPM